MNLCASSGCGWGELLSVGSSVFLVPVVQDGRILLVRASELPVTVECHGPPPPVEPFDPHSFDLFGTSLLFKESGGTCAKQIDGGLDELADATVLDLGYLAGSSVFLETFVFPFAGFNHTSVCVASDGFLTLGGDCSTYSTAAVSFSHFAHPSIAAFRTYLDPRAGGEVLFREISGEMLTVQFNSFPIYGSSNTVSFQIDLFASGDVRLTYGAGDPAATSDYGALVGLSYGTSPPEWYSYKSIDMSQSSPCDEEAQEV